MMKKLMLLFVLLKFIFGSITQAQGPSEFISIYGHIADSTNRKPIDYAVVTIRVNDSLYKALSNKDGLFRTTILRRSKNDTIKVSIESFRYKIQNYTLYGEKELFDLGEILLFRISEVLKEVVVSTNRVDFNVDKVVYNVIEKDFPPNTVLADVARKVPLLGVDAAGNIKVQGRYNATLFMDGKQVSKDQIKNITHEMIKSIEVITAPSAIYSSEEMAIVNIVSKKIKLDMIKGSLGIQFGFLNPLAAGSANIIYKRRKTTLLTSLAINKNQQDGSIELARIKLGDKTQISQNTNFSFKPLQSSGNVSLFIDLDTTRLINILYNYNIIKETRQQVSKTIYYDPNISDIYTVPSFEERLIFLNNLDIDFKKTYKDKSSFVLTGRFGYKNTDRSYEFAKTNTTGAFSSKNIDNYIFTETIINSIYSSNFLANKVGKIETGLSGVIRTTNNKFSYNYFDSTENIFVPTIESPRLFTFNQKIGIAYINTKFPIKKFVFQTGLRVELNQNLITNEKIDSTTKSTVINVLPNLSSLIKINKAQSVRISYNKRIKRPSWTYLNPFTYSENIIESYTGNIDLKPEIRNKIDATYSKNSLKNTTLIFSSYYYWNQNVIMEVGSPSTAANDILLRTFQNIGREKSIGITAGVTSIVFKKIDINLNLYCERYKVIENDIQYLTSENRGILFGGTFNIEGKIAKNYNLAFYSSYDNKSLFLQNETTLYPYFDASLRRNLFDNKITISIRYQDIFNFSSNNKTIFFDGVNIQNTIVKNNLTNLIFNCRFNFGKKFNNVNRKSNLIIDDLKSDIR